MASITENLHTHTWRCKHADGTVADYCEAALDAGLKTLGMSDHCPLPDGRWDTVRMDMAELDDHCAELDEGREQFPQLRLLKGLECEYVPAFVSYMRDELLGMRRFDYLVGGMHWFPSNGQWAGVYGGTGTPERVQDYTDCVVAAIESGLFLFVAHPDLYGNAYLVWDDHARQAADRICEASAACDVPLEINGYGLMKPVIDTPEGARRKYPWTPFWEVAAEHGVNVVVSSDAHRPEDIIACIDGCLGIAERFGLQITTADEMLGRASATHEEKAG